MPDDNSKEAQIASAALAVALTALAIAIVQLLGQLFATADGYRRCQPSVMGAWAQYTRLRWKWSEMRFETLFTTPEILLMNYKLFPETTSKPTGSIWRRDYQWIGEMPGAIEDGSFEDRQIYRRIDCLDANLVDENKGSGMRDEMACWLPFLNSIRDNERRVYRCSRSNEDTSKYHTLRRPVCGLVQRSWDFMAPELVRPLAMTYIGDIAVIVLRLGMEWQTFRPEAGEMRAEGNEHIIYSTLDRSIGPILHYAHGQARDVYLKEHRIESGLPDKRLTIPTREVDMMRFGILPCHAGLMRRKSYKMGTAGEVQATLDLLDPTGSARKKVRDNLQFDPTSTHGFSDLIPMGAPMLRQRGDEKILLPAPTEHCTGLCSLKEGFVIFRQRLAEYIVEEGEGASEQARWVLGSYDKLRDTHGRWEDGYSGFSPFFFDEVYDLWEETTAYFQHPDRQDKNCKCCFSYADLVACHIKHAVNFWHEAHGRIREGKQRDHHGLTDWLAEGMHLYWDYLPKIVEELASRLGAPQSMIRDAWITLIFRAFCWSRSHHICQREERFPESTRLPSRYWESKLPVYLG
ncbi:MAG: hypothetical protein LQ348_006005 [Seirophora lacunosa]|nr:MAG: hypothetical protein LQ344_004184 [Seirophora lacunosa]KAI4176484.1 MAG: hypothetical protein LQ348_006005 [Seirophora lacunosa]